MQDGAAPPSAKVSAAGMLLKFGREGMELEDLAERVEMLERGAAGNGGATKMAKKGGGDRSEDPHGEEDEEP